MTGRFYYDDSGQKQFYYENNGQKQGPISGKQLKDLAAQGTITPETLIEYDEGKQCPAGHISGWFAPDNILPAKNRKNVITPAVQQQTVISLLMDIPFWLLNFTFSRISFIDIFRRLCAVYYFLFFIAETILAFGFLYTITAADSNSGLLFAGKVLLVPIGYILLLIHTRLLFEGVVYLLDWLEESRSAARCIREDRKQA